MAPQQWISVISQDTGPTKFERNVKETAAERGYISDDRKPHH